MNAEKEDFPFSHEITKLCDLTISQEEKLRKCPFAREPEPSLELDDSLPTQLTPIVVVSLPSSDDEQLPREDAAEYYTPPEHHSHSHLSSAEDQNANVRVLERASGDEPESKRARVVAGEELDGDAVALGEDGNEITGLGGGGFDGGEKPQIGRGKIGGILKVGGLMKDGGEIRDSSGEKLEQSEDRTRVSGEDETEITGLGSGDFNGGQKPQTQRGKNGESSGSLKAGGLMKDGGEKIKHSVERIEDLGETEGDETEIAVLGSGGSNGGKKAQTQRSKNVESSGSLMKDGDDKLKHGGKRNEDLGETEGDENEIAVLGSGDSNSRKRAQIRRGKNVESSGSLMKDGGKKLEHSGKRNEDLGETEGDENEIAVLGSGGSNSRKKAKIKRGKNVESSGSLMKDGGKKLEHSGKRIEDLGETEGDENEITVLGSGERPQTQRSKNVESSGSLMKDGGKKLKHIAKRIEDSGETEGDENEITVLGSGDSNRGKKPQTERFKNVESSRSLVKDGGEKLKHSAKQIEDLDETEGDEDEVTVLGSGDSNGGKKAQTRRGKDVESSGSLMKDGGEKLKHSAKKIEDFRYSGEGREVRRARQLPPSFKGKEKEKEKDSGEKKSSQGLFDLLEMLKVVFKDADGDDDSGDVDIIETAKRKGMVFPRPRWWPPPGVDDEHYR